ncbi:hypothetical protein PF003_g25255 [Phytophthora fragariae]|nr:hypothetical protein PF003_g25255 [Phytophthora fragariae]
MQPPSGRSSRARSHRRVSSYPTRGNAAHQDPPEDEETPHTVFAAEQAASGGLAQVLRTAAGAVNSASQLSSPKTFEPLARARRSRRLSRSCKQPLELDAAKNKPCKSESQPESSPQTCPSLVEQATTKDKQCQSESQPEALLRSCKQLLELH